MSWFFKHDLTSNTIGHDCLTFSQSKTETLVKDYTERLLETKNRVKFQDRKTNIQKFIVFLFINNDIKKIIPFAIAKKEKIPRNKPNKGNEESIH